jgi:hypothetical protein
MMPLLQFRDQQEQRWFSGIHCKEGRVQDEAKFGDAEWNCWDSLEMGLVDKVCE